jgi:hypothetical protein
MDSRAALNDDSVADDYVFTQGEEQRRAVFYPLAVDGLGGHHAD